MDKRGAAFAVFRFVLLFSVAGLSSCYMHYRLSIGLSPDLREYYGMFPSIELDIAAVSSSVADQIRTAGVEGYFAHGSALRAEVNPFTIRFSEEITAPVTLSYRDMPWKEWRKKKPDKLVLIVSLPFEAALKGADGRIVALTIKQSGSQWGDAYFEIAPGKIASTFFKPTDPNAPPPPAPEPAPPVHGPGAY